DRGRGFAATPSRCASTRRSTMVGPASASNASLRALEPSVLLVGVLDVRRFAGAAHGVLPVQRRLAGRRGRAPRARRGGAGALRREARRALTASAGRSHTETRAAERGGATLGERRSGYSRSMV